jgi:OFA family oxalate/formate antiporter-like MFS transporter
VLAAAGGWNLVFIVSATITIAAGISAKLLLKPMRARWIESANEPQGVLAVAANNGSASAVAGNNGSASRLSHWPEQTGE